MSAPPASAAGGSLLVRSGGPRPATVGAGRYALGERLGAGAQSEVVRAYDHQLRREVAVKLLFFAGAEHGAAAGADAAGDTEGDAHRQGAAHASTAAVALASARPGDAAPAAAAAPHAAPSPRATPPDAADARGAPAAAEERDLGRFQREAVAVARLRHDGIVRVFDSGWEGGLAYLVMELIDGDTLAERIRRGAPLEERVRAVAEAADAVAHAHEEGVLHRDLKPANVLIDRGGRARVVDFGLAFDRSRETRITRTGELLGTPAYLSPEAARGQLPDERTDVYGLGATLYEALTGRPPFTGNAAWQVLRAVLDDDPVAPRRLDPTIPWDLEAVALRALEKHPIHRYPSARSLGEDLRRWLRGEPVLARRVGIHGRMRWLVRRYRQVFLVLGAAGLFGLGLLAREPGLEVGRARRAASEEILARAAHAQTLDEEIHLLELAVAEDAGHSHARLQLGEALARAARAAAAAAAAAPPGSAAAEGSPAGGEGLGDAARGADQARRDAAYRRALQELETAARGARRPIAALAWCVRGQTIEALGDGSAAARAAAERCYAEASRHDLGTPATLFAEARLAQVRGRLEQARGLYDALLREDAFHALGFARRAEVRLAAGDLEGARADAVRAVELAPELVECRIARAAAREAAGDAAGASEDRAAARRRGAR